MRSSSTTHRFIASVAARERRDTIELLEMDRASRARADDDGMAYVESSPGAAVDDAASAPSKAVQRPVLSRTPGAVLSLERLMDLAAELRSDSWASQGRVPLRIMRDDEDG